MALRLKNRVQETTATTGTGAATLSGGAPTGFQTFAAALSDGDTTYYQITDGTDWEIGLGTFISATNELQRTEVFESSNNNAKVSFSAGSKDVFIVMPAEKVSGTTSYGAVSNLPLTANQVGDQAFVTANNNLYIWNGAGWFTIATVNQTPTISGNNATYTLANDGTATTVTLTGTDPEGTPLTWSATESGDTGIATTTNVDNVFTITPVTSGSGGTMSVTFAASDGVNTATESSTFTLVFSAALWPDLKLSIGTSATNSLNNETFIDRSSNALTVTATNHPIQTALHPYLDNWSVDFDGTGDYLEIPASNDHDLDGDFTIEAWVYRRGSTTGSYQAIFGGNGSGVNGWNWYLNQSTGQLLWFYSSFPTQTATYVELNEWTHIAACRSGTNLYIFKNGSLTSTLTGYSGTLANASTLRIGYDIGANGYWNGFISNLRVVKGTALYTSSFTPSTEKLTAVTNTTLLTCQSNRFIDNSSSSHTLDRQGNPKVSYANPFGQGSEYATGANKGSVYLDTGDEVVITHNASISAGTGDFCLQFWVYADSADNVGYKGLVAKYSGGAGGIWFQPNNGVLVVGFGTGILGTGTKNVMDNQWHHIAWTRSGSANKVFVDGEQELSFTASDNLNNTVDMLIGDMGTLSRSFKGYVSDLKYDVGNAVYTSAFTPPTSPVGNTNADLYLPMDNAGIFDKTSNTDIDFIGTGITTSTAQTKYADTAIYFPSGSNALTVKYADWMDIGTNDFTLELWVRPDGNADCLWSFGASGEDRLDFGWQSTSGIRLLIETGNVSDTVFTSTDSASTYANTWVHIALTKSGTNYKLWVNGTNTASGTSSLAISVDTVDGWTFGAREFDADMTTASNNAFSGYMENIQFVIGTAKYASNFTPPTQEQGRLYQAED
jgi:hypothetical protein